MEWWCRCMKPSTAGHCTAQTASFACLFGCSLLARPLRLGSQRVGSPCSVVSLNKLTTVQVEHNKKLLVTWQFSGPYGVTKYDSGWRKDVVNQCLEFAWSNAYSEIGPEVTLRHLATSDAKDYKGHSLVQTSVTEPPNSRERVAGIA